MARGDAGIVEDREQTVEIGALTVEQLRCGIANLRLRVAVGRQSRGEGEEAGFGHEPKLYIPFAGTRPRAIKFLCLLHNRTILPPRRPYRLRAA